MGVARGYRTIKEVSQETGLTTQQLRKWEERYGVVRPVRLPNGYRGYTADDVARLKQMARWVHDGVQVGKAVRWLDERGMGVAAQSQAPIPDAEGWRRRILSAGEAMQRVRVGQELKRAILHFGLRAVIAEIVRPVLVQVGEWWSQGKWLPDQEQVTSEACRQVLLDSLADVSPGQYGPRALCVVPPGDRHDLPALLLALEAALAGFDARILGPSPAPGAIERAALKWEPSWVAVIATASRRDNSYLTSFVNTEVPRLARLATVFAGGLAWPKTADPSIVVVRGPGELLYRVQGAEVQP